MLKTVVIFLLLLSLCFFKTHSVLAQTNVSLNSEQLKRIGQQIYENETGSNPSHLIAWNNGESFASLGIGHFIWFPANLQSRFTETFPDLINYLIAQGVKIPEWMVSNRDFPWPTKQAYIAAREQTKMQQLRELMLSTFDHQIAFIHQRMQNALPTILATLNSPAEQQIFQTRFEQLAETGSGLYALIDYVNFKGEGVAKKERYNDEGWGLLQVVLNMPANSININQAFTQSCKNVLSQRVKNSPQREVEEKWLAGWKKRCDTYTHFALH